MRRTALVLAALALTACESNLQRSARIEKTVKAHAHEIAAHEAQAQRALTITKLSTKVKVAATAVVHDSESAAAIVTLRNDSGVSLRDVPIQIDVENAQGASVYRNDTAGTSTTLVSVALLPAHATLTWIDDQVQATGLPASVLATVGEGTPATGRIPHISIQGAHLSEASAAEGSVVNDSGVTQQELVIDAVARKGAEVVAAGRAVLPSAGAGSTSFQLFLIGNPAGAHLEYSALATTPG
ncbi:MAG TPA: hypothetical protein VGW98_11745 [Solirubrobacteraceae bacterium]|nr:hypothetical protein [Solirubrobacteraceae bacterium]